VTNEDMKRNAAYEALKYIPNSGLVGIGTGSTVKYLIEFIGEMRDKYDKIHFVPTSRDTKRMLKDLSLKTIDNFTGKVLIDVDGADEIDHYGNLIKGGGGALTREKIVAKNSKKFIVVVDESKIVNKLGNFGIPIEILPFLRNQTVDLIRELGGSVTLRKKRSDNGNFIADLRLGFIEEPQSIETKLKSIPGVVEVGIFMHMASTSIVGTKNISLINEYI
jgi:ribose 5-phosphate isomerase A